MAPSPTGLFHLGTYRTAVFAYLYAKHYGGEFILRIEDTDKERSKKEYEDNIFESLTWLGLMHDRFYRQSENVDSHERALKQLIENGSAYVSREASQDSGEERDFIRFRNPNRTVVFDDMIRGRIETDTTDLGDFVIAKSFNEPLFHLAVVVDDHEEGVTHIIRGEEHIPNTPRQILIREALGYEAPIYAHLPLVLDENRKKLSKRKGAEPVTYFKNEGYLPSAILNFIAFIGWNPGGEREIYSLSELVDIFDISKVQKGGAILRKEKLDWFNKEHIKLQGLEEQMRMIGLSFDEYGPLKDKLLPLIIERITHYGEVARVEPEFRFLIEMPRHESGLLVWKGETKESTVNSLRKLSALLESYNPTAHGDPRTYLFPYSDPSNRGAMLWPLRVALSGKEKSLDPFTIINLLGKDESLRRIKAAIENLTAHGE